MNDLDNLNELVETNGSSELNENEIMSDIEGVMDELKEKLNE